MISLFTRLLRPARPFKNRQPTGRGTRQAGTDQRNVIGLPRRNDMASIIASGRLLAYFQPQICCDTGAVTGFEALARIDDPAQGIVAPAQFMPALSAADHIQLTQAMLTQALCALRSWAMAGWQVPTIAINVSPHDLMQPAFTDFILWELDRLDLEPKRLIIEVPEYLNPETADQTCIDNLRRLARAGCRIDLDDFGTGCTTLESIRKFSAQRLKIDRSFVSGCADDHERQRMILAILALADHLDLQVVAEGVETRDEHYFLSQIGCHEVQGYAIAAPLTLSQTMTFLECHDNRQGCLPQLRDVAS